MACDCADKIDGMLAGRNTRLTRAIVFGRGADDNPNLMLRTEQIETGRGKQKACGMFLTFCPFCGIQYVAEEATLPANPDSQATQEGGAMHR